MTNEELRLAIAKAKGWKFWQMNDGQGYDDKHPHGYDGMQFSLPPDDYPDPASYGFKVHEIEIAASAKTFSEDAPNWPEDIAAAWGLLPTKDDDCFYDVYTDASGVHCQIIPKAIASDDMFEEISATAPRAICLAWLAWKARANG